MFGKSLTSDWLGGCDMRGRERSGSREVSAQLLQTRLRDRVSCKIIETKKGRRIEDRNEIFY